MSGPSSRPQVVGFSDDEPQRQEEAPTQVTRTYDGRGHERQERPRHRSRSLNAIVVPVFKQ